MTTLVRWYEGTPVGSAIVNSSWLFPVAEAIHLLALTVLLGIIVIVSLRLFGCVLVDQSISEVASEFDRYTWISLGAMITTGLLLFLSAALKYYSSSNFRIKMALLAAAIIFQVSVFRKITRSQTADKKPSLAKLAGIISLALWLGVAIAGKAIGYFG